MHEFVWNWMQTRPTFWLWFSYLLISQSQDFSFNAFVTCWRYAISSSIDNPTFLSDPYFLTISFNLFLFLKFFFSVNWKLPLRSPFISDPHFATQHKVLGCHFSGEVESLIHDLGGDRSSLQLSPLTSHSLNNFIHCCFYQLFHWGCKMVIFNPILFLHILVGIL